MEAITWQLIHNYFARGGGQDSASPLVQHQIESYNEFLDKKLSQIIQGFNPIQICHNYKESIKDFTYKIYLTLNNPSLSKPILQSQDGSQQLMTPHLARMNSLTYAVNLYVDINILIETINEDNITERQETKVPNVIIGKIPVMVRSKACVLNMMPGLAEQEGKHECRYDPGGYFIVNGNEKVVISQDRISENKTLVFSNAANDGMTAEIRSVPDGVFLPPKTTTLNLSAKPNHLGRIIRLNTSFLRSEVPVFVMFRALGITTDSDILQHVTYTLDNPKHQRTLTELTATIEDASDIHTQDEAILFLSKYMNLSGTPREYLDNPETTKKIILQIIQSDFLPHVGPSFKRKALYLGSMILKLLHIYLGYRAPDNRDSYLYKRIDTPGILLSNLFRQCYGKMIKEMRTAIQRELQLWRATPTIPSNIINPSNIHRFCKQSIIEMGIRYALSTGNWGVKSLGSFQNIRSGVAQVLNRMSYLSTLSHLRRINTPMEKNGKLVQPRKLENTQYGMICPAETPEGASVGLVKNMALSTKISISMNSEYIRELTHTLGTHIYDDTIEDFQTFLKNMGQDNAVLITINGDLVGYHTDPVPFYTQMKHFKRKGHIPPTTSVSWDMPHNTIAINTEAGRMCRPLYIVDPGSKPRLENILTKDPAYLHHLQEAPFNTYLARLTEDEEGFLEYMDVEEIDRAMVAMTPTDLTKQSKSTWIPPKYTHLEIHPSLMLGVLACNIPFSDHNQSPRNCYQCLWEEEPVLMADGTTKKIKEVQIGDEVLSFDPETMATFPTKVIHQYVKPTDKNMVEVTTLSGRTIVTTDDHKYMTNKGWLAPKDFDETTLVGILLTDTTPKQEFLKWQARNPLATLQLWTSVIEMKENTLFIPVTVKPTYNRMIADITVEADTHCFFGGNSFAVHNSAMGKQAVGIYMSNFNNRIDTLAHILNYPQKPLARTKLSKYMNSENMPSGINAVVAIMTMTGYNQEDSVMVNKSALDRGLFSSTYYKAYREQCSKNHSTGEEEYFTKPEPNSSHLKPYNYDKLAPDGFIPPNTYVTDKDILIGKVMPHKVQGQLFPRDMSTVVKTNDHGHIDMNYQGVNAEGYKFGKVRLRKYRKPTIGDKVASRCAQKGTIGMIYNEEDMPFSKDGIRPDIIMNPHAIPSRMTIGQLMECIMGKACCGEGALGDATPFSGTSIEDIAKVLEEHGMERYGNEILYNGRTGEQIHTEIFIGPTFYQRLKHMVADKAHCLTMDHEVLTEKGWKFYPDLTDEDKVAVLKEGQMVYEKPLQYHYYPDYNGKMYHISNSAIDLNVTEEHRMWVSTCHTRKRVWSPYYFTKAKDVIGKHVKYLKTAVRTAPDYQFELPEYGTGKRYREPFKVPMNDWLIFFGIWMAEGWTTTYKDKNGYDIYKVQICQCKPRVQDAIYTALNNMNYTYNLYNDKITIKDRQLYMYMKDLSVGAPYKRLPDWVWKLSMEQCRVLVHAMQLGDGSFSKSTNASIYSTSSIGLADDFMKLCIHAGWSANISLYHKAGKETVMNDGRIIKGNHDIWRISVIKNKLKPSVNHGHHTKQEIQEEKIYDYQGPVFCLSVSSEVFMVRRNGKAVWTGNSRGLNGPVVNHRHSRYCKIPASLRYGRRHNQIAGTTQRSMVPRVI
jgi:DNA-directed RNA polymerase beta subunit